MALSRLPLTEVILEMIRTYKNKRLVSVLTENISFMTNSLTPNSFQFVLSTYDSIETKLKTIAKQTKEEKASLEDIAASWADLQFHLGKTAFDLQKNISEGNGIWSSLKKLAGSSNESEHVDTLLAAQSYINYFYTQNWFPEFKVEIDRRIQEIEKTYQQNDERINYKPKSQTPQQPTLETDKNEEKKIEEVKKTDEIKRPSEQEVEKLKQENEKLMVDLASYRKVDALITATENKFEKLFPGFQLPKTDDHRQLNILRVYEFSHTISLSLQERFFEYQSLKQDFGSAERSQLENFCNTGIFSPQEFVEKSKQRYKELHPILRASLTKQLASKEVQTEEPEDKNAAKASKASSSSDALTSSSGIFKKKKKNVSEETETSTPTNSL